MLDPAASPSPETPLPGGNVGGAVRVGDTVRRPTGPWTPAVHELLVYLDAHDLPLVPRVLGIDDRGREILSYLPGRVLAVGLEPMNEPQVESTMLWLRQFHETVAGFPRGARRWRFVERPLAAGEIVCHHDAAVYNLAFDGDRLAGVFDWDVAGPGVPLDDLAMFAWNGPLLPLADGDLTSLDQAARGLTVMARAYGQVRATEILDHVATRMTAAADRIEAGQRAGDAGMIRLGRVGEPAATRRRLAVLGRSLPALADRLR
jgi:hypothetical protein